MPSSQKAQPFKDKNFCLGFYKQMLRVRALEERFVKMAKAGDGFFWIGGPGEEAFSVALGMMVNKGEGPAHDFLHLHYRNGGTALTMGAEPVDFIRQMKCSALDPFSGGRNFVAHIAKKDFNILPVTSTIETQFSIAPGTAWAQKRLHDQGKQTGVTVVVGGDAGTAEGDFATCLIWSSRPKNELPLLMIVTNNGYGISTTADTQHGERRICDRAKAFQIENNFVDGTSPEKVWAALSDAFDYVRGTRKPYLLEIAVTRLHGHSSSTGGNRIVEESCPIDLFEKKLLKADWIGSDECQKLKDEGFKEMRQALDLVLNDPQPDASTVLDHSFVGSFKGGLPGRVL